MMAIGRDGLGKADRVWLNQQGEPINLDRAWAKLDRFLEERSVHKMLIEQARITGADAKWIALRVQGRGEIELRDALIDSGIDAVVPIKTVQKSRRSGASRGRIIHKPVLKGLVFVRCVITHGALAGLLRVRGVAAVVGSHGDAHPIGDREMNVFMDLAEKGAFDERNTPTGLAVGSGVKIKVGPYADFSGILEGYAKGRTARVLTYLFGREMTVDVRLAHLEKLE